MELPAGGCVLVADPDVGVGEVCARVLLAAGWPVTAVRTLAAAREVLRGRPYDAVVANEDLWPDAALCDLIGVLRDGHSIPIVLLLGSVSSDKDVQRAPAEPDVAIVRKPFGVNMLAAEIRRIRAKVARM